MSPKDKKLQTSDSEAFLERLRRYPELQAKFEALLDVVENSSGDVVKADEAEERVFEEIRQLGQQAIQSWAERKHQRLTSEFDLRKDLSRKEKKLYWQTRFGKIQLLEQTYRRGRAGEMVRPFCESAAVSCRSYSLGLQRVMTDFGAEESFLRAAASVKEHYRIEVPEGGVRRVTQLHAARIKEQEEGIEAQLPQKGVQQIIAETDGCFIPIVKIEDEEKQGDRRKRRKLEWREARLSFAREWASVTKHYLATLDGVEEAGGQLLQCAQRAGLGSNTAVHCLGDGAKWIVLQVEEKFLGQARYLIDFYHLSEYLSKAGQQMGEEKKQWLRKQQELLKENRASEVLKELEARLESEEEEEEQAPVRASYRYITNRLEYMDYKGAIEAGLPIGSGEIESGHRSVIQARLNLSGAWWREENAGKMLALRTMRASGQWQSYWSGLRQANA